MTVPLDPVGNVSLTLQVTILFLLILGLPSVRGRDDKRIASRHGYFTLLALALHTVLIFIVMIPTTLNGVSGIGALPPLYMVNVVSHIVLGTLTEVLGIVVVGYWLLRGPRNMRCGRMRWWMTPLFVIWVVSLVNGALIHIVGMM